MGKSTQDSDPTIGTLENPKHRAAPAAPGTVRVRQSRGDVCEPSLDRLAAKRARCGLCLAYDHPQIQDATRLLLHLCGYAVASVVPFFVSTVALARTIGVTLIASLAVAFLVQRDALTSVWCFFAAVSSLLVLVAVGRQEQVSTPLGEPVARTG